MTLPELDLFEKGVIERAFKTYGKDNQKIVAIEELSELQKEVSKDLRGKFNSYNVAEEIADCLIMIEQLRLMYGIDDLIEKFIYNKFDRLLERIRHDEV